MTFGCFQAFSASKLKHKSFKLNEKIHVPPLSFIPRDLVPLSVTAAENVNVKPTYQFSSLILVH